MYGILSKVKVLDLSRLLPGAYCSQLLADLGAQVLKVEQPGVGDYLRQLNPWVFHSVNRNKKSLGLDLGSPGGREIFLKLVAEYDVVLETFRPGVMERFGLGYSAVSEVKPAIVYCSLSGYGQTGPYSQRSGHDLNYLGVAGVMSLTVNQGEVPQALPLPLADMAGGLAASHAILAALVGRRDSQRGCYLDASLTDAALSLMTARLALGLATGRIKREDILRGGAYDVYLTGDGDYITIGAIEDKFWKNLTQALGRPDLAEDPCFASDHQRCQNRQKLRQIFEPILAGEPRDHWLRLFDEHDVPVGPVNRLDQVEDDPQLSSRGRVFDLDGQGAPTSKQIAYPVLLPDLSSQDDGPCSALGEDTEPILLSLGYNRQQIAAMVQEGTVAMAYKGGE